MKELCKGKYAVGGVQLLVCAAANESRLSYATMPPACRVSLRSEDPPRSLGQGRLAWHVQAESVLREVFGKRPGLSRRRSERNDATYNYSDRMSTGQNSFDKFHNETIIASSVPLLTHFINLFSY